jgi:hypothetical protein
MTSNEFIFWLKGFTKGVNDSNITPSQWSHIKDMLDTVNSGNEWKPEHGNNSPKINTTTLTPPYSTGGDDEFIPTKELLISNK